MKGTTVRQYAASSPETAASGLLCAAADGYDAVLMTPKAFDSIEFMDSIAAPKEIYLPQKLARDTAAREDFRKEKGRGSLLTEKYILDIIREGWKNDDPRLQRIVLG